MTMLSFVEKVALENSDCVVLYRGISESGRKFFAYLRCNKKGVEKLKHDWASDPTARDISDYGEVLYMDFHSDPDDIADEFLRRYFREIVNVAEPN